MGMEYGRDHNSHWIHNSIQLYNGVMDVIDMGTQKFHTQLKKLLTESMYKMSTLWLKI